MAEEGWQIVSDDEDLDAQAVAPLNRSPGGGLLRRASPLVTNRGTDRQVYYEDLARRPRSNPRSRTPMRFESPLNANSFREVSPPAERREGQRISIRPLAGSAIGTSIQSNVRRFGNNQPTSEIRPKSSKQGPSHRKVRRWNNDNFIGLASELAKSSHRGVAAAETLLLAQADAPKFRSIYPQDMPPSALTKLIQDEGLKHVRHQFFDGEIGNEHSKAHLNSKCKNQCTEDCLSPIFMMKRIHDRLRNVVVRACKSDATVKIVDAFEDCLNSCFLRGKPEKSVTNVVQTLSDLPTVIRRESGQTACYFNFDADSSSGGGYHRLLLHAVCQFHGLHAISTSVDTEQKLKRQLIVSGKVFSGPNFKLSNQVK
mmetsp:Transcript_1258/g.1916  ORF Transcript_1258/g.1916 Transcript_1258/m.1916 type:complete len:370 (-) Transcript_1258:2028-3137(-)